MLKKKMKKFFAFAMALVMTMSVMLSCMSVSAFAVTQSEIDALAIYGLVIAFMLIAKM